MIENNGIISPQTFTEQMIKNKLKRKITSKIHNISTLIQ